MFRIETHGELGLGPSSLGPCIEMESEAHARALAAGLRAEGLDVDVFERRADDDVWRKVHLDEMLPTGTAPRGNRMFDEYVVIAKRPQSGDYELATSTIFLTRTLAEEYARAALPSREALVVRGRFSQLKFD